LIVIPPYSVPIPKLLPFVLIQRKRSGVLNQLVRLVGGSNWFLNQRYAKPSVALIEKSAPQCYHVLPPPRALVQIPAQRGTPISRALVKNPGRMVSILVTTALSMTIV
jgi:hypothetical protein